MTLTSPVSNLGQVSKLVKSLSDILVQSNLDYSKCQGPPDFLRIIGCSNFRNRYFSEMFGSFRSVFLTV